MREEEFKELPINTVLVAWIKYSDRNGEVFVKRSNSSVIRMADTIIQDRRLENNWYDSDDDFAGVIIQWDELTGCWGRDFRNRIEIAPKWIQNCFKVEE